MSLIDLIQGHRPLAHPAATGVPTVKVATLATHQWKTPNRSKDSKFGHETSPSDQPATSPPAPAWTPDALPRRLWFVINAEGQYWSVSFTPPATFTQVKERWPEALLIEPEEAPDPEN